MYDADCIGEEYDGKDIIIYIIVLYINLKYEIIFNSILMLRGWKNEKVV